MICNYTQPPTAITKWIENYPFLEMVDWKEIYQLPYMIIREPYLQSFQYKIINWILNCKEKLKIGTDEKCAYWWLFDNIEHHLFFCYESIKIRKALQNWMINNLEYNFNFTICEILFGILCVNNNVLDTEILNYLINNKKWYIIKQNHWINVLIIELLQIVKNKVRSIVEFIIQLIIIVWYKITNNIQYKLSLKLKLKHNKSVLAIYRVKLIN